MRLLCQFWFCHTIHAIGLAMAEQGGFYVFYLPSGGKDLVRVIDDLERPNGVICAAVGKLLSCRDMLVAFPARHAGNISRVVIVTKSAAIRIPSGAAGNGGRLPRRRRGILLGSGPT